MSREKVSTRYRVEDVRLSYSEEKAQDELYGEWVSHYIYRPMSFYVTPFFLHLGFSPSKVTLLSLMLVFTLPFVALGLPLPYLFIGLIAVVISVFDCVDGNIARVTGNVSQTGHYFDFLTDIIYRVLFYLAIGIVINQTADTPELLLGIATECLLFAALLAIIARMCRVYFAHEFAKSDDVDQSQSHSSKSWLDNYLFPFVSGLDWGLPFIVIIFGFLGMLHWVLIWLLFYSTLDFLHTQYSVFSKLR
ncbi:MAG TPA: CDP-alcohol phosphatidyltransferase family protein [Gammaproteobacteria bacterium]|nr:CDP-alcohol phosphatidyltransferase family protein [Gammaproteobacteria bacterium]